MTLQPFPIDGVLGKSFATLFDGNRRSSANPKGVLPELALMPAFYPDCCSSRVLSSNATFVFSTEGAPVQVGRYSHITQRLRCLQGRSARQVAKATRPTKVLSP